MKSVQAELNSRLNRAEPKCVEEKKPISILNQLCVCVQMDDEQQQQQHQEKKQEKKQWTNLLASRLK